jgi:hypothetical protein
VFGDFEDVEEGLTFTGDDAITAAAQKAIKDATVRHNWLLLHVFCILLLVLMRFLFAVVYHCCTCGITAAPN